MEMFSLVSVDCGSDMIEVLKVEVGNPIEQKHRITACIGYFDGIHKGHQKLLEQVVAISKENNTKPALITFDPDPWVVIKKSKELPHLTTMADRIAIGESLGIEQWIILSFNETMADLNIQEFHEQILNPLNLDTIVCGFDFHYAAKGKGSIDTLKQQKNFKVHVVEEIQFDHEKISSTRIESLLEKGNVLSVHELLGRPYALKGKVGKGNQLGRTIGFPTANLVLEDLYCIPKKGVYIGSVEINQCNYPAIINIGNNPTFNYQESMCIEAHIIGINEDLYDKQLTYKFYDFIREEKRFNNPQELTTQLENDKQKAIEFFRRGEMLKCD